MKNKDKIGIIGYGFVGNILKRYFPDAKVYDIKGDTDSLEEVLNQDLIFIAINFRDNCISDESKNILDEYFSKMKAGKIVVIKSTFVPGTLDFFQDKYKNLLFAYNPEFLTELTAWEDFNKPNFQILGLPHQSLHLANKLFSLLPDAPIKKIISPKDAEVMKHSFNSYYSVKVTFFNQLFDVCNQLGSDYETVREILVNDPKIGNSHSIIFHKGYRGFGGKCLPKDSEALCKVSNFPLLEKAIELNSKLK